jgi:uncharacterized coiled-coil DUF342 family protein
MIKVILVLTAVAATAWFGWSDSPAAVHGRARGESVVTGESKSAILQRVAEEKFALLAAEFEEAESAFQKIEATLAEWSVQLAERKAIAESIDAAADRCAAAVATLHGAAPAVATIRVGGRKLDVKTATEEAAQLRRGADLAKARVDVAKKAVAALERGRDQHAAQLEQARARLEATRVRLVVARENGELDELIASINEEFKSIEALTAPGIRIDDCGAENIADVVARWSAPANDFGLGG